MRKFKQIVKVVLNNMDSLLALRLATKAWHDDLRWVHWHAAGPYFDVIHELAQDYYEQSSDDLDYFTEKLIAFHNNETEGTIDWELETEDSYHLEEFCDFLAIKGTMYLEALRALKTNKSELESKRDEILDYWTTEIEYKNVRRNILKA